MRSRRIPAKQAYDWGIATECVPDDKLEAATDALVDELRTFSPLAQRTGEEAAQRHRGCYPVDWRSSSRATATAGCGNPDDFREGVEALPRQAAAEVQGNIGTTTPASRYRFK